MKNFITASIALCILALSALGQPTPAQVQSRIEGTDRVQPDPVTGQSSGAQSSSTNDAAESDTGAQRPVSLSESEISAYFGYDTKYFYRSNPLAQDGDLSQFETDMWTNTFFGGVSSVIESGEGVYTPYLSGSYTIHDYLLEISTTTPPTFLLVFTRTMVVVQHILPKLTTTWIKALNMTLKTLASSFHKLVLLLPCKHQIP